MKINLELIRDACDWWESYGFYCGDSVPYLVDPDIMEFTCPPDVIDRRLTHINGKQYVASAEQSFLQNEKDGVIPMMTNLKLMALTPCYRDESILDNAHLNIFLKLELMVYNVEEEKEVDYHLACHLKLFFKVFGGISPEVIKTDIGWDVEYEGLELGSFGYRTTPKGVLYVYGTGLAEPRASIAISMG